jgi:hypothetical protein
MDTSNEKCIMTATQAIGTAGAVRTPPLLKSLRINQIGIVVTVIPAGATPSVVTVTRERISGSTTSDKDICSFTITAGSWVAGDVGLGYVAGFDPDVVIAPGESIAFTTDGGLDTGDCFYGVIGVEFSENPDPVAAFTTQAKQRTGIGNIRRLTLTEGSHA